MNESLNNLATIRQYLLGRVSDETKLEGIEELLFSDDEFCTKTEIVEDELINDYVFGKLNANDNLSFEKTLENNSDRRAKVKVTKLLKAKIQIVATEEKASIFDSIKAFLRQPIYAGGLALLLIAILIGAILLSRSLNNSELAELKNIYKENRPIESRISEFDYAPYEVTRGAETQNDVKKRKLKIIENDLLKKVDSNPTANNHNSLGVFYLSQRQYFEAIKELEESTKLEPNNAKFQNDLGSALFEFGKNGDKDKRFIMLSRANESFSKALELNPNFLDALFNKSLYLQENKLYFEAKKSWENYLQKDSNSKWADEARKNLEKIEQSQSSLTKTKEDVLNDFFTAYRNKDEKMVWKIHNSTKGFFTGISLAQQLTRRILIAKQNKDDTTVNESIEALTYIGNLEKEKHADFFFADLTDYYAKLDSEKTAKLLQAQDLTNQGYELMRKSSYTESIKLFEASRNDYLKIGAETESNIAEIWYLQMLPDVGKIDESNSKLTILKTVADKKNYQVITAIALEWLSKNIYKKNNIPLSILTIKESLKISEASENLYGMTECLIGISDAYTTLGETQKASIFLSKTVENEYYMSKSQYWRDIHRGIDFFRTLGHNSTSIDFGKESLEIGKTFLPTQAIVNSYRELGKSFAKKKEFENALQVANEAIKLSEKLPPEDENILIQAEAFLLSANVNLSAKRTDQALADYEKSLELSSQIPESIYNLYEMHKGKLMCLQELQRKSDFEKELEIVLNLSEKNRQTIKEDSSRQSFFANEQDLYDVAVTNALQQGNIQKAFDYAETSRGRSLLDFVKSEKTIIELENQFGKVTNPLTLAEIQSQMPENVQILQYSVLADKLAIWLITKNRFEKIEKAINLEEFEQQTNYYRNLIINKTSAETIKKSSQELYQLLIPNNLESGKIICLIPDKSLHQIPFASLVSPDGKFLIEDYALLYSPSSSVFIATTENAKRLGNDEKLLSIGNPTFDKIENPNLKDLPEAEFEAKEISKFYSNKRQFIGNEATKNSILENLGNVEIIHYAGHFVVNNESPSNSKMLLTDNDLSSSELAEIKLSKTKLVVLSACETGFEKLNKSEGSIGIARTFLAMGTPLVVASNWKVNSEATKDLMMSFHQKRIQEKLSSIESLRQAQLQMLNTQGLSAPYYWSAFSISGGAANY